MATPYTPSSSTFHATVTLPDDGDARSAASVNVPLEGLADNAAYLKNEMEVVGVQALRNGTQLAMVALTGMATGAVFDIPGQGLYTFVLGSIAANDSLLVIPSTDATGKWIHQLAFGANSNTGFVVCGAGTAPSGRILSSLVPNRLVALGFISSIPNPFSTSSTSAVDVPGYSVALTCVAGDVLLINTSILWIITIGGGGSGDGYSELAVVDGGSTTVLATEFVVQLDAQIAGNTPWGYSKFVRAYVVLNSGTVTVKGRVRVNSALDAIAVGKGLAQPDHASIVVQQIRS